MKTYKELDAWKRSIELAKEAYLLCKLFPREEMYGLTSQIKRAAVSVPSNIAEGIGRNFKRDSIQFFHVSRGSLYELETLLTIAFKTEILSQSKFDEVCATIESCIMMINGLIKYFERGNLK